MATPKPITIAPPILAVLGAATVDGTKLTLNGQLDRKTYEDTNKVLTALGGKWSRKDKAHVFPDPVEGILDQVLNTGTYARTKQDLGQFDTPMELARMVADAAGITAGALVLEPSGGMGNLVQAALDAGAGGVTSFEIDPKRVDAMRARFGHLRHGESDRSGYIVQVVEYDFLQRKWYDHVNDTGSCYTHVIMNPPFAGQDDIRHVMHAMKFVQPGGTLVAIMSASVLFRDNMLTRGFRAMVEAIGGTITPLPEGSFKESGTAVNTVLVVMHDIQPIALAA